MPLVAMVLAVTTPMPAMLTMPVGTASVIVTTIIAMIVTVVVAVGQNRATSAAHACTQDGAGASTDGLPDRSTRSAAQAATDRGVDSVAGKARRTRQAKRSGTNINRKFVLHGHTPLCLF